MKKSIIIAMALALSIQSINAQIIDIKESKEYSPYIFGHNLEHTRAAINQGLSAQMLKNRKFAGKASRNQGVASKWFGIGEEKFSFEKQVLEKLIMPVGVFESDTYFIDIGIPEEFERANAEKDLLIFKSRGGN
jgi:hypothetical protein